MLWKILKMLVTKTSTGIHLRWNVRRKQYFSLWERKDNVGNVNERWEAQDINVVTNINSKTKRTKLMSNGRREVDRAWRVRCDLVMMTGIHDVSIKWLLPFRLDARSAELRLMIIKQTDTKSFSFHFLSGFIHIYMSIDIITSEPNIHCRLYITNVYKSKT